MVGTWNEWVKGEQLSADVSKDIEPNNVWGDQYLVLLKSEIKKFKGVH
jgi:lambda repressor-like predicted transcriptional regulator